MRSLAGLLGTIMLASVANAGIVASTTTDLRNLTPIGVSDVWLLPGLILVGTLMSLVIGDVARTSLALVAAAVIGASLFALAIAAPGFAVEGVRVTLIDRATNFGLLAFLMSLLFGLTGMVLAWIVESVVGRKQM